MPAVLLAVTLCCGALVALGGMRLVTSSQAATSTGPVTPAAEIAAAAKARYDATQDELGQAGDAKVAAFESAHSDLMAALGRFTLGPDGAVVLPAALDDKIKGLNSAFTGCLTANGAVAQPIDDTPGGVQYNDPDGSAAKACSAEHSALATYGKSDEYHAVNVAIFKITSAFEKCVGAAGLDPHNLPVAVATPEGQTCRDQVNGSG